METLFFIILGLVVLCLLAFAFIPLIARAYPNIPRFRKPMLVISFIAIFFSAIITFIIFPARDLLEVTPVIYPYTSDYYSSLVKGKMAYSVPDTMKVGQNYKAIVSITKAMDEGILYKGIEQYDFYEEEIVISSRVKVSLLDPTGDDNFIINPLNTEEQIVDEHSNTVWRWNISPKRGGNHELVLRTTIKIKDDLGEYYKDITVFEKNIKVNASITVSIKQFWRDYWQWVISVIILPLLLWSFNNIKGRRKKKDAKSPIGFRRGEGKGD
jgi:hypothetical protein